MPLTITEEMIRQDPFFQEGLEDGFRREHQRIVMSLYKKGKSFEEIAELLGITVKEARKTVIEVFIELRLSLENKETSYLNSKLPPAVTKILAEMIELDPCFQQGFQEGVDRRRKEIIQRLYIKAKFSPEKIADLIEVPLEFVNKAVAELQKGKEEK